MNEPQELRNHMALNARLNHAAPAAFEVLAITAGEGNGWQFTPASLRDSLALWDGVECFVDHAWAGHSIRDLAGVFSSPAWDNAAQGIRLTLKPLGPSAELLRETGRQLLDGEASPRVGFSADLTFTAGGREVRSILRVHSVDLVCSPARGGAFLRALNSKSFNSKERLTMSDPETQIAIPVPPAGDAEAVRQMRLEMCSHLLDSALAAAGLPAAAEAGLRRQFGGQIFQPAALNDAVAEARRLVSDLTGALVVQGPGRIHSIFSSEDQLQAAVDDLLDAPRQKNAAGCKTARLSGIRELYVMLTGDDNLHGGYHTDRVRLATTADFTGLVKNALNKVVVNTWEQLGIAGYDWWSRICTVEHFNSLQSITGTLVGTVGSLPEVAEGGNYTELAIGDSPETASWKKYGGYIPLTLELIDRDETRKLKAYPRELAAAGLRKISALVSAVFTDAAGVGPTMADGAALFNTTAASAAGGHNNLTTTALSAAQWEAVCAQVYGQPMLVKNAEGSYGVGPRLAINPRYLVVPRALQLAAMKVLYPSLENAANIYSENMQRGQPGDVVTVPEWTDATNWAAVCDPLIAPAIFVGERFGLMPEIFIAGDNLSPAVFTNDEHRLKVRHFLAVWVNDWRPLHKANVAG